MSVEPYLDAIQEIPGDNPREKFKWIDSLLKERLTEYNSLEDVLETEKIPRLLVPLVQVEAALALIKKNPNEQSAYSAITEALKSEDVSIANRAFRANSFFDGTNKTVTNVRYLFENLFPYVTLNNRVRIVKTLARRLYSKNPELAQEFFNAVASHYGVQQALPLLLACDESFAYKTIVENRIVLSRTLIKQMFRKNPDLVVRYFRLSNPNPESCTRNLHQVNIHEFGDFLEKLIKKRINNFVELYEMHEKNVPKVFFSKKCAEAFLKNGSEYFIRKPKLYIDLVPLKMIGQGRMELIYPKLFPDNVRDLNVKKMLDYLKNYPQDNKVYFFLNTYQQVYGKSILDNPNQVTCELMKILPTEERIKQARIKLEKEPYEEGTNYETSWKCYLPVEESIPLFKKEIATTSDIEIRSALVSKMIYSCKVNNDDKTLLEILQYIANRHMNEQALFKMQVFDTLLKLYDLPSMNNEYWEILMNMITYCNMRSEFVDILTGTSILEAAAHHKILQNEPIDRLMEIFITLMKYSGYLNILQKYPEYERMCLEACIKIAGQNYCSNKPPWAYHMKTIIYDLCYSIYFFNDTHRVSHKGSRIERMSIKNYRWLKNAIQMICCNKSDRSLQHLRNEFATLLKKNEKDLYYSWRIEHELTVEEMLKTLKENPGEIQRIFHEYFEATYRNAYEKQVRKFVKATYWYKDIPIMFVDNIVNCGLRRAEKAKYLRILSLFVRGETFVRLVEPFMPNENRIDYKDENSRDNFSLLRDIIFAANRTNPPIPLTMIAKLFEDGKLLPLALVFLVNVIRRTNSMDAIAFARNMANQRVSVQKHGIRLMDMIAPRSQLLEFLRAQWDTVNNHSIQEILFNKIKQLFEKEPSSATWTLLSHVISTLTPNNVKIMSNVFLSLDSVPDQFVTDFLKLSLDTIDKFEESDINKSTIVFYTCQLLKEINASICNLLSEDFVKELIRRYFFHRNTQISDSAITFVVKSLLLPANDKFDHRMNIFSSLFTEMVRTSWNVPDPKNKHFYPVNNAVDRFARSVALESGYSDTKLRLIDEILPVFCSILTPQMVPSSYLLLVYAKEQISVATPREFGIKIGRKLPELTGIFSEIFIFFIIDTFRSMLDSSAMFDDHDRYCVDLEIIEGLMEIGSWEATLMAVKLLSLNESDEYAERFDKLITSLSQYNHPVVKNILCDFINKTTFK